MKPKDCDLHAKSCKISVSMNRLQTSERGIVAIFSVMIIMGILTLLAVGFSVITRTAQRNTLDDQFSTQAFYAAESGINDAVRALTTNPSLNKVDCTDNPTGNFRYDFGGDTGIGYTCVLVNTSNVTSQEYDAVPVMGRGQPIVTPINTPGTNIQRLAFQWDAQNGSDGIPSSAGPIFSPAADWGSQVGIIRVDLVPLTGGLARDQLANNAYTFLLYPSTTGTGTASLTNAAITDKGVVVSGSCNSTAAAPRCNAEVTLTGAGSDNYMMRIMSYYNQTQVSIRAYGTGPSPLAQVGSQAIVDVTGRSNDVYRRIQVRVPTVPRGYTEAFSLLSADSLCKRLVTAAGRTDVDAPLVGPTYGSCDTGLN